MTRPSKNTVEYFPHFCAHGKTMSILENSFGNDGYSFWFKLLEILGVSNNHFYDCRNPEGWWYLISKTKVTEEVAENILNLLSKLGAIDADFWKEKIIWSQNFVTVLEKLYERRVNKCMQKQDLCKHLSIKCNIKRENVGIYPQSKVKERKEKGKETFTIDELQENMNSEISKDLVKAFYLRGWNLEKNKLEEFKAWLKELWEITGKNHELWKLNIMKWKNYYDGSDAKHTASNFKSSFTNWITRKQ